MNDEIAVPRTPGPKKRRLTVKPAARRTCVLVLGMHRSGTSALTRAISLLGAALPKHLLGAHPTNETGHWEPHHLIALHDRMLAEAGSSWDDWRAFDPSVLGPVRLESYGQEIARLIGEEYTDEALFVLKEPRICRFVPFYEDILARLGVDMRYVLTTRNPLAVAASLGKRDGITGGFSALLWLRHGLEAERATRGRPRVFVSYENMVADWRPTVERITATLDIAWPHTIEDASAGIERHFSPAHQHHVASAAHLSRDERTAGWVKDAYGAFKRLEADPADAGAMVTLDRVKAEFDAVAPIFGEAFFPELDARQKIVAEAEAKRLSEQKEASERVAAPAAVGPPPMVSVIVPVKDGLPHFERVIEMLRCQDTDFEYEVIIIDSGSKDGSLKLLPANDDRFTLIEIPPASFGHGRTRNLGIARAKGEYCAFLTHDAVPANRQWLREIVKPLREDSRVAGVFGRHVAYENASPFSAWELETHFAGLKQWPVVWISDAREYVRNQGLRQVFHFYSDNSSCLRKSVWAQYPYPDVPFAEDQLWAKTIVEAGYRKAFAWNSVVYHSHDYSFWERLKRSYDESKALYELFGYRLCASRREAARQVIRTTARDVNLAFSRGWVFSNFLAVVRQPLDNLARQVGYYLGTANLNIVKNNEARFSRDKELQRR